MAGERFFSRPARNLLFVLVCCAFSSETFRLGPRTTVAQLLPPPTHSRELITPPPPGAVTAAKNSTEKCNKNSYLPSGSCGTGSSSTGFMIGGIICLALFLSTSVVGAMICRRRRRSSSGQTDSLSVDEMDDTMTHAGRFARRNELLLNAIWQSRAPDSWQSQALVKLEGPFTGFHVELPGKADGTLVAWQDLEEPSKGGSFRSPDSTVHSTQSSIHGALAFRSAPLDSDLEKDIDLEKGRQSSNEKTRSSFFEKSRFFGKPGNGAVVIEISEPLSRGTIAEGTEGGKEIDETVVESVPGNPKSTQMESKPLAESLTGPVADRRAAEWEGGAGVRVSPEDTLHLAAGDEHLRGRGDALAALQAVRQSGEPGEGVIQGSEVKGGDNQNAQR